MHLPSEPADAGTAEADLPALFTEVHKTAFDKAVADGFETYEIAEAVRRADYHVLLITDEIMPQVFDRDICPNLKPGQAIVVSSGYNVTYDFLRYPATVDVLMIAPRTIGTASAEHNPSRSMRSSSPSGWRVRSLIINVLFGLLRCVSSARGRRMRWFATYSGDRPWLARMVK